MAQGTVKWFNATKGFGFINPDGQTKDVFVHVSQVTKSGMKDLAEGQRLSFDIGPGGKGEQATNLRAI